MVDPLYCNNKNHYSKNSSVLNGEFVSVLVYIKVCEIPIKLFKKKFSHQQAMKIWLVY